MIRNISFFEKSEEKIVVALGFFDCFHLGHRKIVDKTIELAKNNKCSSALLTFENNFFDVLGRNNKLIYTFPERKVIAEQLGLDLVISCQFDKFFMNLTSSQFLEQLEQFNISAVVCGFDYTFGSDKADVKLLSQAFESRAIPVYVIDAVTDNGAKISSTLIRQELAASNIIVVNKYLNSCYTITGIVVQGRHVGGKIGFPTANLQVSKDKLLPNGVFGGKVIIDGKEYKTIVNVGSKPTFEISQPSIEAHIIDFSGDLYGKEITVAITKFLRPIQKFRDTTELVQQLKKDTQSV